MVLSVYRVRRHVCLHASVWLLLVHLSLRVRSLLRGQQLVKCYRVDEKLQQIPLIIIPCKRKLTK